ncbi:MAG: hypothetical protein HY326_11765 [Chloroflexi bacterium]|nr:hypothetical protein [Chloroflexota bacterium]
MAVYGVILALTFVFGFHLSWEFPTSSVQASASDVSFYGDTPAGLRISAAESKTPVDDTTPVDEITLLACSLKIAGIQPDGPDLYLLVQNDGSAAALQYLSLQWADAVPLIEIDLNGRRVWNGEINGPATLLNLSGTSESDRTFSGSSLNILRLRFGGNLQRGPRGTLIFAGPCPSLNFTLDNLPTNCEVKGQSLIPAGKVVSLVLSNEGTTAATLSSIRIVWPSNNGGLTSVNLGNNHLWTGNIPGGVTTISIAANLHATLETRQKAVLTFEFEKPVVQAPYEIIVLFTNACPMIISRLVSPPACNVSTRDFSPREKSVYLTIQSNQNVSTSLASLVISWPPSNGALTRISLNDSLVSATPLATSPVTINLNLALPLLSPGENQLRLDFEDTASTGPYAVEARFSPGCSLYFTTVQPVVNTCKVEGEALQGRDRIVDLPMKNQGNTSADIRSIQIVWSNPPSNPLLAVRLDDHIIWQGSTTTSPLTLAPSARESFSLGARSTGHLRLEFANPVASQSTATVVTFVQGCRVSASLGPVPLSPTPDVRLQGYIVDLPAERNFYGLWSIGTYTVTVDSHTVISPSGIIPRINDFVQVSALVVSKPAGLLANAIFITSAPPPTSIDLRGPIDQVLDERHFFLQGRWILLLNPANVNPRSGLWATVHGILDPSGTVLASEVRIEIPDTVQRVHFEGPIISLSTPQNNGVWVVGQRSVVVQPGTLIDGQPQMGAIAEVTATLQVNQVLVAESIRVSSTPPPTIKLSATIRDLPSTGFYGTWKVRITDGPVVNVQVDERTLLNQTRGRIRVGAKVTITATEIQENANYYAQKVVVER